MSVEERAFLKHSLGLFVCKVRRQQRPAKPGRWNSVVDT